jgi:hypothetical protein
VSAGGFSFEMREAAERAERASADAVAASQRAQLASVQAQQVGVTLNFGELLGSLLADAAMARGSGRKPAVEAMAEFLPETVLEAEPETVPEAE